MNFTIRRTKTNPHNMATGRKGRVFIEGDAIRLGQSGDVEADAQKRRTIKHGRQLTIALRDFLRRKFDDDALRIAWTRNAGCSMCPCSPGWVVTSDKMKGKDVLVARLTGAQVTEAEENIEFFKAGGNLEAARDWQGILEGLEGRVE